MPAAAPLPGRGSTHVFSVAKELPRLAMPLATVATAAHWSLIRIEKHQVSDVLAGGAIGLGVAYIVWKAWPPGTSSRLRWPQTAVG
jgi:membrane-associated phospholipid phosphatase